MVIPLPGNKPYVKGVAHLESVCHFVLFGE